MCHLILHSTHWSAIAQYAIWCFTSELQCHLSYRKPRGSVLSCIVYTPVCQEHHASLFLSKGDLHCQLVRLLVSGRANRPFVGASLPAGAQKAAPDFLERETASRRSEGGNRESLIRALAEGEGEERDFRVEGSRDVDMPHRDVGLLKKCVEWERHCVVWSGLCKWLCYSYFQANDLYFRLIVDFVSWT